MEYSFGGVSLWEIGLWTVQFALIFIVSTTLFDILHWLLHRWGKSSNPLLRRFSRWHWVHHQFLDRRMRVRPELVWKNIWFHILPEFATSMAATALFLFVFPWQPVAAVAVVRFFLLVMTLKEEGMDVNHMSMKRVSGRHGLWWVDAHYHAMHHVYPNSFYSSFSNVFDLVFGTTCQISNRKFVVTGASGAFGAALVTRLEKLGAEVRTLRSGQHFGPGHISEEAQSALQWADVLVLSHGAKSEDCWNANVYTFVDLIERFKELGQDRLVPPEVWGLGSEVEIHGDFGMGELKDYAATKRAFAAHAKRYYQSPDLIYRHIVPSAFTSRMGPGLMSAETAVGIALFFIRRGFRYVPVTYTTLALWNYFRFRLLKAAGNDDPRREQALAGGPNAGG